MKIDGDGWLHITLNLPRLKVEWVGDLGGQSVHVRGVLREGSSSYKTLLVNLLEPALAAPPAEEKK